MEKERVIFNTSQEKRQHLLISFGIFIFLTIGRIVGFFGDDNAKKKAMNLFNRRSFLFSIILILCWSIFILGIGGAKYLTQDKEVYNSYVDATKKAILAIIVAVFAKMDLVIPVFWFIWLMAFYFSSWS
jgi:hypothetical protein